MKIRVRKGDSLSYLSTLFEVPLNLILDSNQNMHLNNLKLGDQIKIPGFVTVPYTIRAGDSFWKLAAQEQFSVDVLMLLNQQTNPNRLMVGDTILLPNRTKKQIFPTNSPCDYRMLKKIIMDLSELFPFITVKSIGQSVLGNSIQEIRIGKGKKKVHINASFHANEWITTLILMSLLNSYLLLLTKGVQSRGLQPEKWYQNVELSLVPMVNPDGVDLVLNGPPCKIRDDVLLLNGGSDDFIHWKANIRGVDLNKQFPANWDLDKERKAPKYPAPRDFPGSAPLTEPESIAMADLAKNNDFDYLLAFHTQGEEFYWGYEGYEPTESQIIAKEFEKVSGYKAIQYIDSHAGYKDWFLQEFKRPGFTIELGKGVNPLPLSQFDSIFKKTKGIFYKILSV